MAAAVPQRASRQAVRESATGARAAPYALKEMKRMSSGRISRSKAREHLSTAPVFVLVEPQMGENIGAAARAMLNFGVSGLRLVAPRDGWPNAKAAATASGAAMVIDEARVFDRFDDALADRQFVIATTARRRELMLPVMEPAEAAAELRARMQAGERCAVVFGNERNGLSSDDVARCDAILSVPVNPAFASLNLSQAVLIAAYEWSRAAAAEGDYRVIETPLAEEGPAPREDVARLLDHLEAELDAARYFFPPEMRPTMERNLRAAITRAGFTQGEIRTLRGVVKALSRERKE